MPFKFGVRGVQRTVRALKRQRGRVHRALVGGVRATTDEVKDRARRAVRQVFPRKGFKVARIVRGNVVDKGVGGRVFGIVFSKWSKRSGADPIASRLFGGVIVPKGSQFLVIKARSNRNAAGIRTARRQQKTYFVRVRPGKLVLIGRGKSGRARPRVLFTLVHRLVVRGVTTPRRLMGGAGRRLSNETVQRFRRMK